MDGPVFGSMEPWREAMRMPTGAPPQSAPQDKRPGPSGPQDRARFEVFASYGGALDPWAKPPSHNQVGER